MAPQSGEHKTVGGLTPEDGAVLRAAEREGRVAARLYVHGDFSEAGFLLYGRLESLCARGLLRFESWSGDAAKGSGEVLAVFTPARGKRAPV
jgi:hypothetical protein